MINQQTPLGSVSQILTSAQEIYCIFQSDENIKIFDQDNWEISNNYVSEKQIPMSKANYNITNQDKQISKIISKLQEQLTSSKDHFYQVKVKKKEIKKQNQEPITQNNGKGLLKQNLKFNSVKSPNSIKSIAYQQRKSQKCINNTSKLQKISINMSNRNSILKQGYLNKKTDGFFFKWNMRYMVLTPQKLYSFESDKKEKVISCVNLKLMNAKVKLQKFDDLDTIILDFQQECQNLILQNSQNAQQLKCCSKQKNLAEWKYLIEKVINFQAKQNKILLKTATKPIYDSKDTLSEKDLIEYAETGDILLFYTENTGAKLQRLLTNSQYDHVAMIIKLKNKQMMVFESNSLYGVSVYQWKQYIQYFNLYQRVTLRKLNYVKKAELHHTFLSFARKNMGRKYDINAYKLLKMQSVVNWEDINAQIEAQQARGYFCSQLIAKAFKSAGLLQQKKSSAKYWPVDFSEKYQMNEYLKKGAQLGPQQMIILNKHRKLQ